MNKNLSKQRRDTRKLTFKEEKALIKRITEIMRKAGVSPNLKGYYYIREAIYVSAVNSKMQKVTLQLYPYIAEKYETTPDRVERAIRYSIGVAWNKDAGNLIKKVLGEGFEGQKPTNSEFIAMIADKLRLELKSA